MFIPLSTYRLQFNADFGFKNAEQIAGYLAALGIGSIYASPSFTARRGSQHGYDVADNSRFSRELGGETAFLALSAALRRNAMGFLLDIVPNHMAASPENPWWRDLLANGRESRYADFFDVDWDPSTSKGTLQDRLLLPVLGAPFGTVLENQEISIRLGAAGFTVNYYELSLPVRTSSYAAILGTCLDKLREEDSGAVADLQRTLQHLHAEGTGDPDTNDKVRRQIISDIQKVASSPAAREAIDERLRTLNGRKNDPDSFNDLESILVRQPYRLAYWRRAVDEVNYRRFFDITDLVGVRVEKDEVFREQHERLFQLVSQGDITGLRIDHIDGLYNPAQYLKKLQANLSAGWNGDVHRPDFHVVVEKILASDEQLPDDFAAGGTSGYDFMNVLNNLFVEPAGLADLDRIFRRFTGFDQSFEELAYQKKKKILGDLFWGDVRRLGDELIRMALQDRHARDIRPREISEALVEVTARMQIYRTYIRSRDVSDPDRYFIEQAIEKVSTQSTVQSGAIDFIRRVLLMEVPGNQAGQEGQWLDFVMRWQQFTGRVMAKGVEDTSFYIFNRLISMNEVGGEPDVDINAALPDFHQFNSHAQERWPLGLNATSTHDTKRSEDVRARIDALSEFATEWESAVERWREINRPRKSVVHGSPAPDANEELMLYQTLLGIWPMSNDDIAGLPDRIEQFVIKSLREAKTNSSWHWPDEPYEQAVVSFARSLIIDPLPEFRESFLGLQSQLSVLGALNSLGQVAVKITAPGIPDFYQGTELWDLSLVDPDNRRPVDYPLRREMVERLQSDTRSSRNIAPELAQNWCDGKIKLFTMMHALAFRHDHQELFIRGRYLAVIAEGSLGRHVVAFLRNAGNEWSLTVVPRFMRGKMDADSLLISREVWGDSRLILPAGAPSQWKNIYTEMSSHAERGALPMREALAGFPVAILQGLT